MSNKSQFVTLCLVVTFIAVAIFTAKYKMTKTRSVYIDTYQSHSLPDTLLVNTNPKVKPPIRGLASKLKKNEKEIKIAKGKVESTEDKEEETYSLDDPNLYEGDFSGVSDLEVFGQINNQLSE